MLNIYKCFNNLVTYFIDIYKRLNKLMYRFNSQMTEFSVFSDTFIMINSNSFDYLTLVFLCSDIQGLNIVEKP